MSFTESRLAGRSIQSQNDFIQERRRIWRQKPILRRLYSRWYQLIREALRPGRTLELGGGSGNLKEYFPRAISSDILFAPWLDAVLDALYLPFSNESMDNIVLFDVLHHLSNPGLFFSEAERVLKAKGRIILMEPYVSLASGFVYRYLHAEGMDWKIDPFIEMFRAGNKEPFQGNQAIPTLLFKKCGKRFAKDFPHLKIIRMLEMDSLIYPLSGGFHNPCLCPAFLWPVLERIEKLLRPLNTCLAFRLFLVLEKA